MRHLFIINPVAGKVNVAQEKSRIHDFFCAHPSLEHDIYVTQWCRDAVGYVRGYIMNLRQSDQKDTLRIHVMGGSGVLYEVANAIIGIPDIAVAAYPLGNNYPFLRYFAPAKSGLFTDIEKQVFSRTIPIDVFRCGHNIGINASYIGMEALANTIGDEMIARGFPSDFSYVYAGLRAILGNKSRVMSCALELDGQCMDGEYISMMIANGPCYGNFYCPAPHAHPDDGLLDIYLVGNLPKQKILRYMQYYLLGHHEKVPPDLLLHYRGKKLSVSSEKPMHMCIDGENFVGRTFDYAIMHHAIRFVCPEEVDLDSLPILHNNPKSGRRGGP